jgi:UDP-N-acetylglucosamine 4,6-dehydratase
MKNLLITGGTGSFGSTVLESALKEDWDSISILSRDEKKQHDLRMRAKDERIKFIIGDTRDLESVTQAVKGISHIFHAAALKQVPSCEFFPDQAVLTNVIGTQNTLRAAKRAGVERVVVLSTDKAAYPINAMGMTKALAEKIAFAEAFNDSQSDTIINVTRYGNVMGSRGSVIPLFVEQANNKSKFTVTHSSMTRFMMSLDESVSLVKYAMTHGKPGELYVQKARSSNILEVCKAVDILLGTETAIETVGIRGGEKLHETLVTKEEMTRAQEIDQFYRIEPDVNYLSYNKYFQSGSVVDSLSLEEFNSDNAERITAQELATWFHNLSFHLNKFHE